MSTTRDFCLNKENNIYSSRPRSIGLKKKKIKGRASDLLWLSPFPKISQQLQRVTFAKRKKKQRLFISTPEGPFKNEKKVEVMLCNQPKNKKEG